VYRNGVEIGRAQIGGVDAKFPSGSYAYAALAITLPDGSRQWQALGSASGSPPPDLKGSLLVAGQNVVDLETDPLDHDARVISKSVKAALPNFWPIQGRARYRPRFAAPNPR
jgi:hypothetical protein